MPARSNLDLEQDPLSIIATRVFEAPRALVFEAWSNPKHLAQFEDLGGNRTRITLHAVFPSAAERERVIRE